jgi:two-component system, OmpR family, response regulator
MSASSVMPRVMIVDDDPAFGAFVRAVAQGCGYDVLFAGDGVAFQAGYARTPPDLILLDLQMPGTDGIELLRSLADAGCTAPIVVMSGFDPKVVEAARLLGIARGLRMARTLIKPVRPAELKAVLSDIRQGLGS